ncbi:MAG: SIR2 family protein [Tepidisphaeraceae bacterium]
MTFEEVIKFIQGHFTDGLVLVVGSGLSAAEGMPGMPALADHLKAFASELSGKDATLWASIAVVLNAGLGLEAAMLKHAPSQSLEAWITKKSCDLLIPSECQIIRDVIKTGRTLRLTRFLAKILKPVNGLPILTPNYDRLIEVACEMAGFHVDTMVVGQYAGEFDPERSCMGSCRGIAYRGKTPVLDHFPRAVVLKPHGSFDWYHCGGGVLRSSMDIDAERAIITPGLNKYKAGYNFPFDKHREFANNHIDRSARLLVVGYGFNDDHLQTHLETHIRNGTPTLILTHTASATAQKLATESPNCVCLARSSKSGGITVLTKGTNFEQDGPDLWDLGILVEEILK